MSFLTIGILFGIWFWNRSPNYYAEAFYFLKASLVNEEDEEEEESESESDFGLALESFESFFQLLKVNDIPINFDELMVLDLFWVIQFFEPENKALGEDLYDDLFRLMIYLHEKKWLDTLKTIEAIENNLEAAKKKLGSVYLNKEYIKEESSLKKNTGSS